jgi:hypothetical protein
MYTKLYKYRGFLIYENTNKNFGTKYYSVVNPNNHTHIHVGTNHTKKVIDCYYNINKCVAKKYPLWMRNKAMALDGYKIIDK